MPTIASGTKQKLLERLDSNLGEVALDESGVELVHRLVDETIGQDRAGHPHAFEWVEGVQAPIDLKERVGHSFSFREDDLLHRHGLTNG